MSNLVETDLITKEYLLYRGYTKAYAALEEDRARDRLRNFETKGIADAIYRYLNTYEVAQFLQLWGFLEARFFFHLDAEHMLLAALLKKDLLKMYLVNACARNKPKITEFFASYAHEILAGEGGEQADLVAQTLRPWFALPFVEAPERDPEFSAYFDLRWQETLKVTLENFLSIILRTAPEPKLVLLEKWYRSDAQVELRKKLVLSDKRVEILLAQVEFNQGLVAQYRETIQNLATFVKSSIMGGVQANSVGLFETDTEAETKKTRARELCQSVCRLASGCVEKGTSIASMPSQARMEQLIGEEKASVFFGSKPNAPTLSIGRELEEQEQTLLAQIGELLAL